jgi:hypothetical protein
VEKQAEIFELSEFHFGRGISPIGIESDFIEIEVQEPAGIGDLFEFNPIVNMGVRYRQKTNRKICAHGEDIIFS